MKKCATPEEAQAAAAREGLRFAFRVFGPRDWYVGTADELQAAGLAVVDDPKPKRRKAGGKHRG